MAALQRCDDKCSCVCDRRCRCCGCGSCGRAPSIHRFSMEQKLTLSDICCRCHFFVWQSDLRAAHHVRAKMFPSTTAAKQHLWDLVHSVTCPPHAAGNTTGLRDMECACPTRRALSYCWNKRCEPKVLPTSLQQKMVLGLRQGECPARRQITRPRLNKSNLIIEDRTSEKTCQHHCDVGESHSWICHCRCDASWRAEKAQTALRLEMMWCQHGCDSWGTRSVHQAVQRTLTKTTPLLVPSRQP